MKNTKYRILQERTLSDGWGKLQAITYEQEDRDGKMTEREAELYDAGNAVAVLLYDATRNTVLLTRQFRIATVYNGHPDGMLLEVCAGKIEGGLSVEATVRKELREETGYAVHELMPVMQLYMSPGAFTEKLHLYAAPYTPADKKEKGGGEPSEGEAIELHEVPFGEAVKMLRHGEIVDAKTVILLQWAITQGLLKPGSDNATGA